MAKCNQLTHLPFKGLTDFFTAYIFGTEHDIQDVMNFGPRRLKI